MSDVARRIRSERRVWAAPGSRHDRMVAALNMVLPMAIGVLTAFLVTAPIFMGGDVSFVLDKNKVEVAKERLRIQSAQYRGEDAKGQAFTLTAGSAVQKSSAEPIVHMDDLAAQIELPEGPAQLHAERGRYDMDAEKVAVDGPIAFQAADGYRMNTSDAVINLKSRALESTRAVTGQTPLGSFSGDRLSADLASRTVRLDGNAHLRIVPGGAKGR